MIIKLLIIILKSVKKAVTQRHVKLFTLPNHCRLTIWWVIKWLRASKSSGYESEGQTNSRVDSVPVITKENRQWHCRRKRQRHFYLHIKAKVLLFLKEEIKDKLPNKVRVQCVIDHFCPAKLKERHRQERHWGQQSPQLTSQSVCLVTEKALSVNKVKKREWKTLLLLLQCLFR